MRVIQVTDYGSPFAGAFVPMLSAALRVTREGGWEALAVLPERARARPWLPAFQEEHGSQIVFAPAGDRRALGRWLEELVDGGPGPTRLHTNFSVFDLAAARLACRRRDVRTIWHFQTVLSESARARLRNRLRFATAGRCVERMLCVAPHLVEGVRARGAPAEKAAYFPNAVDTDRFDGRASHEERLEARTALGLEESAKVLLHVGRDWTLKGGDLFLDAFARLEEDGVVGLMLRGGDDARREIVRRGLEGRAQVLDGTSDMRRLYAASDVMLATSRGEGMPFAMLEALSSGLAVVATDIPGHRLADPPNGLRVVALSPDAIAAAVTELLAWTPERIHAESEISHQWVRGTFGLDAWAERLAGIYHDVMRTWMEA